MSPRVLFAAALALAASNGTPAAPLRTATPAAEELLRGEADGVGITSRGLLFPAPTPRPLGEPLRDGTPAFVWSLAVDGEGRVFAGTGPDGKILRAISAELQLAGVRQQLNFSLATDFENFSDFRPGPQHLDQAQVLFDQLEAWTGAMKTLR